MFIDLSLLNGAEYTGLQDFVYYIINFAISFSVLIAVVAIVIAGFKLILSVGNEKKIAEATKSLLFALVGLILVFLSPTIIQFVIDEILIKKE